LLLLLLGQFTKTDNLETAIRVVGSLIEISTAWCPSPPSCPSPPPPPKSQHLNDDDRRLRIAAALPGTCDLLSGGAGGVGGFRQTADVWCLDGRSAGHRSLRLDAGIAGVLLRKRLAKSLASEHAKLQQFEADVWAAAKARLAERKKAAKEIADAKIAEIEMQSRECIAILLKKATKRVTDLGGASNATGNASSPTKTRSLQSKRPLWRGCISNGKTVQGQPRLLNTPNRPSSRYSRGRLFQLIVAVTVVGAEPAEKVSSEVSVAWSTDVVHHQPDNPFAAESLFRSSSWQLRSVAGEPGFEPRLTESESLANPRFHTVFLPNEEKMSCDLSMP
jgi:hypothetical protein